MRHADATCNLQVGDYQSRCSCCVTTHSIIQGVHQVEKHGRFCCGRLPSTNPMMPSGCSNSAHTKAEVPCYPHVILNPLQCGQSSRRCIARAIPSAQLACRKMAEIQSLLISPTAQLQPCQLDTLEGCALGLIQQLGEQRLHRCRDLVCGFPCTWLEPTGQLPNFLQERPILLQVRRWLLHGSDDTRRWALSGC